MSVVPETWHTWVHETEGTYGLPCPCGCCSPALAELWCYRSNWAALPPPMTETRAKTCRGKKWDGINQDDGFTIRRVESCARKKACTTSFPNGASRVMPSLGCSGAGLEGCVVASPSCNQMQRDSEIVSLAGCLDNIIFFTFPWC